MTDSINKDMNLGFQFLDLTNIPDEEANRIKNVLKDNSRDRPVFFLQDQYKWKEKDKQETQQDYEEQEEPNVVEDNQKDSNITPGSTLVHEYQQLPVENVLQDNFHPQYPVSCVATPVMPPGFYPQMPNILVNTVSPSLQSIPYVMPHVRPYTDQEKIQAEQKVPGYTHGPPPFVSPAFVPQTVFHPNHPTPQSVTGAPYIIQTPYYVTMTPYTPPTTSVLTGVGKPASTSKYNKKDKPKDVKLVAEHRYVEKEKEKYGNEKEITQKDNTMEATNIATTQELKAASLSNGFPDEAEEAKNEVKCSSVSNETGFEATEEVKEVKAEQHLSSVFPPARKRNDNPVEVEADPTPSEPVAPAPKSWASLFKAPAVSKVSTEPVPPPVQTPPAVTPPPANCDPDTYKLAMHLNNYALVHEGLNLQPRGLLNKGNYCYINAVLQGLMGCPPFYNMIRAIEPIVKMKDASAKPTPVMETLVSFVNEFVTLPPPVSPNPKAKKSIKPSTEISHGLPFEPSIVYSLMQTFNAFKEMGRQEDAEELLTVLLNALNDEMIEFVKLVSKPVQNGIDKPVENGNVEEPEEWQVIGPKNKGTVTRSATICRTPVGDLFLGQMRSVLQTEKGMCTATLQPFFTLQLDIQNEKVNTVNEALDMLVVKEPLVGYIDPKNKKEISASRQTTLEALPPVLMLHLKCFLYDKHGGCQKLMKKIDFPLELEIPRDVLSSNIKAKMSNKQRNYKLFAVIYHDGKEATKGHYVADVYHPELQRWIRYDDAAIKVVDEKTLLRHSPPRVPYLLFYRRKEF